MVLRFFEPALLRKDIKKRKVCTKLVKFLSASHPEQMKYCSSGVLVGKKLRINILILNFLFKLKLIEFLIVSYLFKFIFLRDLVEITDFVCFF